MRAESIELSFRISNLMAMAGWGALILFPKSPLTRKGVRTGGLSALFGLFYGVLFLFGDGYSLNNFQSLAGVHHLFQISEFLLAGWIHYLAFDLFVGGWIVTDAENRLLKHRYVIPSLILTFLFGPLGFVSYLVTRKALCK